MARYAATVIAGLREQLGLAQVMPNFGRLGRAAKDQAQRLGSPHAVAKLIDTIVANWQQIAASLGNYAQSIDIDAASLLQSKSVLAAADRLMAGQTLTPRNQFNTRTNPTPQETTNEKWEWRPTAQPTTA